MTSARDDLTRVAKVNPECNGPDDFTKGYREGTSDQKSNIRMRMEELWDSAPSVLEAWNILFEELV